MIRFINMLEKFCSDEKGVSLIAVSLFIMAAGLMFGVGSKMHRVYETYQASVETDKKMDYVQKSMEAFFSRNGHYPCPAPLNAPIDSPQYGVSVVTDCMAELDPVTPGTFRAPGRDNRMVRTGAIPTRTLNIDDSFMIDGYDQRLMYSVTEAYAIQGTITRGNEGAITILDGATPGNQVLDNAVKIVYSMGWDDNGAFNANGFQNAACDVTARSGENCDLTVNATFTNTVNKSTNEDPNSFFVHKVTYLPSKTALPCQENGSGVVPGDIAFLVDTSGSMAWYEGQDPVAPDGFEVKCPESMPGCSRVDVARWAMKRAIPTQVYMNSVQANPGETGMTGFVGYNNVGNVSGNLGDMTFFDPEEMNGDQDGDGILDDVDPADGIPDIYNYDSDNDGIYDVFSVETFIDENIYARLDDRYDIPAGDPGSLCPTGSTPLGIHIDAMANDIGSGTEDRPNKIIVISDGVSNNGTTPADIVADWDTRYPNVTVDIIDVVGNPDEMRIIADATGGSYYRTDNPQELLDALRDSTGTCAPYEPNPIDRPGCGTPPGVLGSPTN